ncbi:MAG: hypothetical protein Q7K42_02370, partial [Candidatus Diapherotrites archaeon]|nr:hypothetical protein [Candidatus Diapherotrites archaeon]
FTLPSGNQEIKLSLGPEYGFAEQSQAINVESSLAKSFLTIGITIIALAVILGIGAFAFLRMKKKPVEKPRETTIWSERKQTNKAELKSFKEEPEQPIGSADELKLQIQKQIKSLEKIIPKREMSEQEKLANLQTIIKEKSLKERISEDVISDMTAQDPLYAGLSKSEIAEVETLVQVLSTYKSTYSAEDIENAAIAEGTSPKIAKLVAKKLYGN